MGGGAGRGKFKGKPTGRRNFSQPEDMVAGTSTKRPGFKKNKEDPQNEAEDGSEEEDSEEEEGDDAAEDAKKKGVASLIEIENPNVARPRTVKASSADADRPTELSRREREELQKQAAHERYLKLQEQGKTEQARKDLDRLALIRQQRLEAAQKREEEKAGQERTQNLTPKN
eukprot:SM000013S26599  [mRNA]  locus=s13:1207009:1208619:- [translate_table: standard]